MAAESELPPLPNPDVDGRRVWSADAMRQYATAARAPLIAANAALVADKSALLSRIAELEAQVFTRDVVATELTAQRDTLRAELERCRADAERWRFFLARRFVMTGNLVVMDAHRTAMKEELISAIDCARAAHSTSETRRAEDSNHE